MEFGWSPGIGDPTVVGWLTVVVYLVAAACSFAVSKRLGDRPSAVPVQEIFVWRGLVVLFLFLGLNKQLDLQSLLTEVGRYLAYRQGWYERRHLVQMAFVFAIAAFSVIGMGAGIVLLRGVSPPTWIALAGTALVLVFVVIRAASFHHVDVFISTRIGGVRWNAILEIGGLTIALLGAGLHLSGRRAGFRVVVRP